MAGQSSAMIGWSWTDVIVLGSQVFGQALMNSCAFFLNKFLKNKFKKNAKKNAILLVF